ncbi:MAG: hypothetical protein CMI18_09010 [Opitutaceae bacterium]|nr:hypothetical protein [Opitutaceae bacterium]
MTIERLVIGVYRNGFHLQSKVSDASPETSDAISIVDEFQSQYPDTGIVVLGNMNDFEFSPTLWQLADKNGLINLTKGVHLYFPRRFTSTRPHLHGDKSGGECGGGGYPREC